MLLEDRRSCFLLVSLLLGFSSCGFPQVFDQSDQPQWRPVVLMHGVLGTAQGLESVYSWITSDFPGIYVHNVEIGNGYWSSLLMDINLQVETFAAIVRNDTNLQKGFNMVCHSQGGLICRAYIERYNDPPVFNYVSWAGPQNGVYGSPDLNALCPDYECPWLASVMDDLINGSWTEQVVQETFSFGAYWKDPLNYDDYLAVNIFLADINNERESKNSTYRNNMLSLNAVLLLDTNLDLIVVPWQSPWFYFYEIGDDQVMVPFNQSGTYQGDWIGLRTLDENNKIEFVTVPCLHHDLPNPICKIYYDKYTKAYLNNTL